MKEPAKEDRVSIPLDPEEALRALLKVDPDSEPVAASEAAAVRPEDPAPSNRGPSS
jgi:hypothetical protein